MEDRGLRHETIIVMDFGGQYNQLIARRVRELSVYCEMVPYYTPLEKIKAIEPKGIILSEGPSGVDEPETPHIDQGIYNLGVPVLEIGYGTQLMAADLGGEVKQTPYGQEMLKNFVFDVCGCKGDWSMGDFIEEEIDKIRALVGDKKVVCGLSGGVDSSVAAVLVHRAIGDQLTCIFVDHGLMRYGEADEVCRTFGQQFDMNFVYADEKERFLSKLQGVTDPERKRKIIGEEFIRVFEDEANKLGSVDFLVQGTLYSDVIESGTDTAQTIKSHHNVGGLPEDMELELIEPLRDLFKDEVRKVGEELGLPQDIVWRQPFPGPGLAIRIAGEITPEKVEIVREADAIVRQEIEAEGLGQYIWQGFAILLDVKAVGVMDDKRTYAYPVIVRAVTSEDAMTADWAKLPYEVLERIASRIANEVENVNRVLYDITAKPPGTIEWE